MTFTHDEAANMLQTVITDLDLRSVRCFAHMLNTMLKNAMTIKKIYRPNNMNNNELNKKKKSKQEIQE